MRFGTRNVRSMYRPRPITTVARRVVRYRLNSVGMQVVRWDKGGVVQERIILFCRENAMGGTCGIFGQEESFVRGFDGISEGNKQICRRRRRRRWKHKIKMDIEDVEQWGMISVFWLRVGIGDGLL